MPEDPLVSDRERVEMTVNEVWKLKGYVSKNAKVDL
jgi:hypothetical protein